MSVSKTALSPHDRFVIFPTNGWQDAHGHVVVRVHGWVFSLEEGSAWRRVAARKAARWLGDWLEQPGGREHAIDCFRYFLVDNKPGRRITIGLGEQSTCLPPSRPNGHLDGIVRLETGPASSLLRPTVPESEVPHLVGSIPEIALLQPEGLSIVCDIDDTLKVSQVRDKRELLRRTFFQAWEPVLGMPELLRQYTQQNAALHYVTAMPWPLYPTFSRFLDTFGIPHGSMDMREFRWKDRSALAMIRSSESHKRQRLLRLLERFPLRKFLLIGDSAERDPEIYGDLARTRREQVVGVWIRNVSDEGPGHARYDVAFAGVDRERCVIYDDAQALPRDVRRWVELGV